MNPTTIAAQISPQRSTQYSALANALAPYELMLSPLGSQISEPLQIALGGQPYLKFDLTGALDQEALYELAHMAMTNAFFGYHEEIAEQRGPFLQPLSLVSSLENGPQLPAELAIARRYRGKTNELFTQFLCNLARYSSDLSQRPWQTLRILDPLAGGGTTLFTGLVLGADVAGVEQNLKDVQSTVTFLRQFAQEARISHQISEERLKKLGHRWVCKLGKNESDQQAIFTSGDTALTAQLVAGFRPHLIVTDLPYGIQHNGKLIMLLQNALPVWEKLLPPSGCLAFSWDATRFSRVERVDRVIKERDIIVAR